MLRIDLVGTDEGLGLGNALGYSTMKSRFANGLMGLGWVFDRSAPVAFHMVPPWRFQRRPGKFNVLLTMWENDELAPEAVESIQGADVIIVPSRYCAGVFSRYYSKTIEVVPLGADVASYTYLKRRMSVPFRFLWVGAPNIRKGWDVLHSVWEQTFAKLPQCQLYLKTTQSDEKGEIYTEGNVILDTRFLTKKELVGVYHSAHAFVLPHFGEGWGLTLSEAMATGLPCITTQWSGVLDFTDAHSVYYVGYEPARMSYELEGSNREVSVLGPNPQQIANAMERIIKNYEEALDVGKKASRKINRLFTWEKVSKRLSDVLAQYVAAANAAGLLGGKEDGNQE